MTFLFSVLLGMSNANANPLEYRKTFDAAGTRGLLLPSSETLNKGQFTLSSIELLFFNASYGVTDNVMVSLTSFLPIVPGMPFIGTFSAKVKLVENDRFVFSVQPNAFLVPDAGGGIGGVQLISDIALSDTGNWILTLSANPSFIWASVGDDISESLSEGLFGLLGVGIQGHLHQRVKFMSEVVLPSGYAFESGESYLASEFLILNTGLRFPGEKVSFDVSFIRPLDGGAYLGLPFVTATGRFN